MISDKFADWIARQGGPNKGLHRKLGVTTHSIRNWLRGDTHPKIETARTIIILSRGHLTYNDLLGNPFNITNQKQN